MKYVKRILSVFLGGLFLSSLCACGGAAKGNTTYSGTITALSLTSITLQTENGEVAISLSENTTFVADISDLGDVSSPGGEMGQLPDGDTALPDGVQPPEGGIGGDMMRPDGVGGMDGNRSDLSIYNLSLGTSITVETDGDGKALTVTVKMGDPVFRDIGE